MLCPNAGFRVSALRIGRSNVELHLAAGATLLVSDDIARFPAGRHIISAEGVHDVAITGPGGVDGQGLKWWRAMKEYVHFGPILGTFLCVLSAASLAVHTACGAPFLEIYLFACCGALCLVVYPDTVLRPGQHDMWRPHTVDFSHVDHGLLRDVQRV